jgi:hypothetical protein
MLTTDIPECVLLFLMLNGLNVEANGWNDRHKLIELELIKQGGLPAGIIAEDHDAFFFGLEKAELSETSDQVRHVRQTTRERWECSATSSHIWQRAQIHTPLPNRTTKGQIVSR